MSCDKEPTTKDVFNKLCAHAGGLRAERDNLRRRLAECERERDELLAACQLTYRKHWLGDEATGWDELGNILYTALCNAMGDYTFQKWLKDE